MKKVLHATLQTTPLTTPNNSLEGNGSMERERHFTNTQTQKHLCLLPYIYMHTTCAAHQLGRAECLHSAAGGQEGDDLSHLPPTFCFAENRQTLTPRPKNGNHRKQPCVWRALLSSPEPGLVLDPGHVPGESQLETKVPAQT